MPDITSELYTIRTNELGNDVLGSIYDALLKIDSYIGKVDIDAEATRTAELLGILSHEGFSEEAESYNITEELEIIKTSRYGSEIRQAIHDALDKLNQAAEKRPKPESGGKPVTASLFANAIRGTTAYATRVNVGQVNMMQYQWEQGSGNPSTGEFSGTSTSRIRSQTYVPVPEGAERYNVQAKLADGTELRFVPYSYGDGQGDAFISAPDWQNYNAEYAIPTGAKYVRLLLAKSSGNIAYTNLASCLLTFY